MSLSYFFFSNFNDLKFRTFKYQNKIIKFGLYYFLSIYERLRYFNGVLIRL